MSVVKGSKQYPMIVVAHRPWRRAGMIFVSLLSVALLVWLTYQYGLDRGLAARASVVTERDALLRDKAEQNARLTALRQEMADLRLGGQVDTLANEEVRQAMELLQTEIAELNEEIRFYKGVMVPNAAEKGLRIERFGVKGTATLNRYRYNLMLTQVVDKHDYVQGGVDISILGREAGVARRIGLKEFTPDGKDKVGFRYRYFQNIEGDIQLPVGFTPTQMRIRVRPSGGNAKLVEKLFEWQVEEG